MQFSAFFIKRPIFATVLAIVMVLAGIMAYHSLPVAQFPDITPPTIVVSATYPGANAQTLAQTVATPIEEQVNGVEGMLYMSSTSGSDGSYQLTITFKPGTDIDQAAVDVQNLISMANSQLPEPVIQQGISVAKQSSNNVLFIALQSDKPELYDALYLTNYAKLQLVDPIARVEGVGGVSAFGGGVYDMRVWLDPAAMKARGVTADEVSQAINAQNVDISAGSVGQQPGAGKSQFVFTLSAEGRLKSAEEFGNIVIRSSNEGILRLKDIAKVELGSSAYSTVARINGKECALLGIQQLPGANALDVANGALAELENLSKYFPDGVRYNIVLNSTDYVTESVDEVAMTFVETTLIVLIVILLFLQNWRAVVIPLLTIPVSLIGTFAIMKLMGFSLNTLTLFGLVLAIAIVVDDAIVVVEDCSRLIDKGTINRKQAAAKAMKELTGPVVGEVLVLMSVFIPTAFISGITGSLYKQFALTIAVSTALSGFNALTLTPALCGIFLRPRKPSNNIIYKGFNKGFNALSTTYQKAMEFFLRHAVPSLVGFIILVIVSIYAFAKYPSSYLPEEDMGYYIASLQLPNGAALERTENALDKIETAVKGNIPAVKDILSLSGISMLGGGNESNMGSMFIILKPWNERKNAGSIDDIMRQTEKIAADVQQEGLFFAVNPPSIPGLGVSSGLQMQLLDINNLGATEITKAVEEIETAAEENPLIASVTTMYEGEVPQYSVKVDRDATATLGLNVEDVYSTVSTFMGGSYVGDFIDFGRIFQITMQAQGSDRSNINDIYNLSFRNSSGDMVPFAAVATIEPVMGQPSISRYNTYTTASLTANPANGVSSSQAIEAMEDIVNDKLGKNFSYAWTGLAYQETNATTTISFVFIFAIIMTLLVLAAQYESWTDPMAVVLAMPIAVLGTLLGVMCMRQSVSIYTQIGVILLLGMAAKNAILIVQYAIDFRKSGIPINKSAHDAGVIRFRPIMMTALAFILGVMPMLFATGAGANSRKEIGTAIVFGMTINAIIGTLLVPTFWYLLQNLYEKHLKRKSDPEPANTKPTDTDTPTDATIPQNA